MSLKSILTKEIELISLSKEEVSSLTRIAKDFIKSLKAKGLTAHIGGSLAKGTLVKKKNSQDVDIFVVFNYSEDIFSLEKVLKSIKLPGKLKKVHGSRDYFQIKCDNVLLEVIPVVKNKDPELAENVTDVSLSHVKYVVGEVKKNPRIADEIKLAKAFCRAQRCYGAEGYVKGFSGYSLEILVIYFGGFAKFLKGMSKNVVIDPLKYFKGEREILTELNTSKLSGPVILIDPTYKFRNVSAGLGFESFEKFNDVAAKFLKNPGLEFFERQEIDIDEMKAHAAKSNASFVEVDLRTNRQEGDIAGTKMKKFLDFFASELERKQQKILDKEFDYIKGKRARGYLVVLEKPEIENKGPSVGLSEAVKGFKKAKGRNIFKKKGFWWYTEKVSIKSVFELIQKSGKEMGASGKLV
jgi:tRNA nucleotidyltransferase (CCA-adding enzyme)